MCRKVNLGSVHPTMVAPLVASQRMPSGIFSLAPIRLPLGCSLPVSTPDSESTVRGFEASRRVFNRFLLIRRLGSGGMGEVWLARDESLDVEVCLKFLPEHVRWSPGALAAHKAEALRARELTHPNIVRVHDFAEDGALAAIVMEFVDGCTLTAERLARPGGILTPEEITHWLPQLAAALNYLHREAGVAHGDLKPANVLLRRDGVLKLADFGVAREFAGSRASTNGAVGGTLPYLSPQRVLGATSTPADDIYALGALLYELLTSRPPFFEGDVGQQIELLAPESLTARRRRFGVSSPDDVPIAWETAIQACLAKRTTDRPSSADEVVRQLGPVRVQPRRRTRAALLAVACLAGIASVWWWREHAAPVPAKISARVTTEFTESFDSGLAGWVRWGEPTPRLLSSYQGRAWVFDNNGDGIHHSGATSIAIIAAPQGFDLRSDVRLDVTNPAGCHLDAYACLTFDASNWMNALGSDGDAGNGVAFGIEYAGDTCWGTNPEFWRHAYFAAWFTAEDGKQVNLDASLPRPQWVADAFLNRWVTLRVEARADRTVRFYADDRLIWSPTQRLHPRVLAGQRVVVHGQSAGSAGKAYHDSVDIRASSGGTLAVKTTAAVADAAHQVRLPWNDSVWAQRAVGGASAATWPADGSELLLATPNEGALALRTRESLRGLTAVEVEVQPFLNSGGAQPDVATIFIEQRIGSGWQRWAAELRATEIWLVERDSAGHESQSRRVGTYAPGAWTALVFTRTPDNTVSFVGSRLQPQRFDHPSAGSGEWAIGFELAASADGVILHPARVSIESR